MLCELIVVILKHKEYEKWKEEEVTDSDGDVESGDGGKVGRGLKLKLKLMESLLIKKIKGEEDVVRI